MAYNLVLGEIQHLRRMKDMIEVLYQEHAASVILSPTGSAKDVQTKVTAFDNATPINTRLFIFMEWSGHARALIENAANAYVVTESGLHKI
jgi:hypothetical protein